MHKLIGSCCIHSQWACCFTFKWLVSIHLSILQRAFRVPSTGPCQSWPPTNPHPLDCLYDSLPSPPLAGVWWAHPLDWFYDSLSSPPVAGVWWVHTLDCLYDSLSSPPVAGVWWAHTLDCLYDSLSSPPVAGVWWAHTLDWLQWLSPLHL